jgi:two-component system KDP operon response regulator KdpE
MRRQSRQAEAPPPIIHAGDLTIDVPRRLVTRAGEPVHLSPKEYDLLVKLAEADGKVLSHKELLISLWGPAHAEDMQYLRVFIGQLRQKIEADPSAPRLIRTQPGIGYRFMADEAARPAGA